MRRREFVALLGAAAITRPLTVLRAQQKPMPVVGFLSSLSQFQPFDDAFRRGLADGGYADGRNVAIEYRWIEDSYEKLPAMAADLVGRGAAVIGALGPPAVIAAKAGAPTVPIVFITGADPVKFGFVESFNRQVET